ncbi:hypothetical protein BC833DRAFT_576377 [Globomyces pollinis-pini]|nr:hypothetical protein BC833DRAFT_576377 [Globomyces pollinis-pini]
MSVSVSVGWARFFFFIGTLTSIVSLGGGGLVLPPFKTFPWLITSSSQVGIYGACPLQDTQLSSIITYSPDWQKIQSTCVTLFQSQNTATPVGRMLPRDEVMIAGLHGLALTLTIFSLLYLRKKNTLTSTVLSFSGFLLHGISTGLATWNFYKIRTDLANGLDRNTPILVADTNTRFGLGLYVAIGASVCLLFGSALSWLSIRVRSSEKFGQWNA